MIMNEDVLLTDYRDKVLSTDALAWTGEASRHQPPTEKAKEGHAYVAGACTSMLRTILANCPPSRDRTIALNKIREARMWANSAIATEGKL
jgi:hypothetical protein